MASGAVKKQTWTYVGQATGGTTLNIPTTATEISGYLVFGGNSNYGFSFFCVRNADIVVYPNQLLFTYYSDTNDRHEIVVEVNWATNQVRLVSWRYNENDFISTSSIKLFYK